MTLSVEYEKPCQRRHYRVTAPLFVTYKANEYRAADWSIGGLRLENIKGKLPQVGERIFVQITLPFQDFRISCDAELEIVRHVEGGRGFGARFTRLGEREKEMMSHFIDEIVRGSMSEVKDTIARMDTPLTPVSTKPSPSPASEMPVRRWTSKTFVMPVLYGLLGLAVFGYAAFVVYANVFHMVVESAVIGGRVGIVKAQSDGEIIYRGVKIGQAVKKGEVIAQIEDPVLEARIQKGLIEIKRKQAELTFLQQESGVAYERMKEYAVLQSGNLKNMSAEVRNLGAQVRHARAKHGRLLRLLRRGRATRKQVDDAKAYLLQVRTKLAKARANLKTRKQFVSQHGEKAVYDGKRIIDNTSIYRAKLEFLKSEVDLAREEYNILVKQREQRVIRAPYDSRIVDLPKYTNSTIIRGDVLVIFEPTGSHAVTAYLTQKEILKVKIGDKASVFVPALDKSVRARIKSINRSFSFVDEKDERYTWRSKDERNAEVILEIASQDMDIGVQLTTGLPAVVMFRDREASYILSYLLPGYFNNGSKA